MHDPMIQILHIPHIGGLWHVDPERGGNDDSCNWSGYRNRLTDDEREWCHKEGAGEHHFWIAGVLQQEDLPNGRMQDYADGRRWPGSMTGASALELVYAVWSVILWRMPRKGWRGTRPYTRPWARWEQKRRLAAALPALMEMVGNGGDNLQSLINHARDPGSEGAKAMGQLFAAVLRIMRGNQRPWWRHPRFHVWHWRFKLRLT